MTLNPPSVVSEALMVTIMCSDVTKERTQNKSLGNEKSRQPQFSIWKQVSVKELPETLVFGGVFMKMERALGIKSCSFIRVVFVIFQALTGSDFSDRVVPIVMVSPELPRCSC